MDIIKDVGIALEFDEIHSDAWKNNKYSKWRYTQSAPKSKSNCLLWYFQEEGFEEKLK